MKYFSRIINALFRIQVKKIVNKYYLAVYLRDFFFLLLVILVGILLQLLVILTNTYRKSAVIHEKKIKEYQYWSEVAYQYPTFPDINYNAALSALKLGKKDVALRFITKAISLDPLFQKAIELKKEIVRIGK